VEVEVKKVEVEVEKVEVKVKVKRVKARLNSGGVRTDCNMNFTDFHL
jgi:hypothetical protein